MKINMFVSKINNIHMNKEESDRMFTMLRSATNYSSALDVFAECGNGWFDVHAVYFTDDFRHELNLTTNEEYIDNIPME